MRVLFLLVLVLLVLFLSGSVVKMGIFGKTIGTYNNETGVYYSCLMHQGYSTMFPERYYNRDLAVLTNGG